MIKKHILIVEDEFLVGLNIRTILTDAGFTVSGPAMNVKSAMKHLDGHVYDAAVLDVNLGGQNSGGVAAILTSLGIPFVLVTGYGRENLPEEADGYPLIEKPFDKDTLIETVQNLCSQNKNGNKD